MGRETYELQRTDSICPTPEWQLFEAVKENDTDKIKLIVTKNPEIVKTIYGEPYEKPILSLACSNLENVQPQTVQTLVDVGCDLHHSNPIYDNKQPLHFAAVDSSPAILRVIVGNLKGGQINALANGNTALNCLVKERDVGDPGFMECLKILIDANVDVNRTDGKNLTPIFWAAKKGYKEVVSYILLNKRGKIDIDSHTLRDKSARDFIIEKNLISATILPSILNNNRLSNAKDTLFNRLKENDLDSFTNSRELQSCVDDDDGENTLLQLSCMKGLTEAVTTLLDHGADPNLVTARNPEAPIEIAGRLGYHAIFRLLIDRPDTIVPPTVLNHLVKQSDEDSAHENIDHRLCYKIYLSHKDKVSNVNVRDELKNTPLHYATRYGGSGTTIDLLRCGASLASKNRYGFMPIEDIDAGTLEAHLNECVEARLDSKIDKENFEVTFNYRTLMPPKETTLSQSTSISEPKDIEAANRLIKEEVSRLASETEVLQYMSKSPELKHLLQHPVITSFLYMKWHRIRCFFYANLMFYITFCLSLLFYILVLYPDDGESNPLLSLVLVVTFFLLVIREVFQGVVNPRKYFLSFENWVEIFLIVVTGLILFQSLPDEHTKKQLSAIAILLAAFELVLLIGQHPKMSTNIVMLRTVSYNFFKFFLWSSILILAFALSFHTLFKETPDKNNTESEEQDFFMTPGISLLKTIVMLTGEFDASSINFQKFPVTSHIIFVMFVFLMAIILFNLLNGLAVSDTQLIKSNAELVGHVARIEHIAYIESMLLSNALLTKMKTLFCCIPNIDNHKIALPLNLSNRACLFPHFLKDYKMTIQPNRDARVILCGKRDFEDVSSCAANCTEIYLDKQTAKKTKALIRERKEIGEREEEEKQERELLKEQQRIIEELKREQKIIIAKLDCILSDFTNK